ncbi:mRNA-decapping enzyme 1B-like [Elysia marginata]|uniref:mRNA-decapping enzyme 1B-like n=1 Tax=Elysia marginata TaxID=1093978 RepID=A0AAV4ELV5_9GAST|nr:mRNA-decapping enzyme 1B-like [Elysia marginata]
MLFVIRGARPSPFVSASPKYGLIILNRKDLNNLVQPLTKQVEFHLNTPFLLYKKLSEDPEDAILGIWFLDRDECIRITSTIQRLIEEVSGKKNEQRSDGESGSESTSNSSTAGQNILSLLTNAQKTYDQERGATHDQTDPRPIKHASGDASGMSQISLDDLFRTVNLHQAKAGMADSGTDMGSKSSLFARSVSVSELEAQQEAENANAIASTQDTRHPILKLISSKTVEELEKQHLEEHKRLKGSRVLPAKSPSSPAQSRERSPRAGSSTGVEAGGASTDAAINLMQLLTQGVSDKSRSGVSPDSADAVKRLITMQDPHFGTNRGFIPVPSGAQSLSDIEGNHPGHQVEKTPTKHQTSVTATATVPPPPPSVFALPRDAPALKESAAALPVLLKPSDLDPTLARTTVVTPSSFNPSVKSLLTPQAFSDRSLTHEIVPAPGADLTSPVSTSGPVPSISASAPAPLTREQLQTAMLHLIKNDSSFLNTLHAAYLESFHTATTNTKSGPHL